MTAPITTSLSHLLEKLDATAEALKGGNGSCDALRKNGRGEGLAIAASMIRKAWPTIRTEVDLTSAAAVERLRAALHAVQRNLRQIRETWLPKVGHSDVDALVNRVTWDADFIENVLRAPSQTSEPLAGIVRLVYELEVQAEAQPDIGITRSDTDIIESKYAEYIAGRLRELLGLPPKEDR